MRHISRVPSPGFIDHYSEAIEMHEELGTSRPYYRTGRVRTRRTQFIDQSYGGLGEPFR